MGGIAPCRRPEDPVVIEVEAVVDVDSHPAYALQGAEADPVDGNTDMGTTIV